MAAYTISEFADKLAEIMQVIAEEFIKYQNVEFYKAKITFPQFIILELLHKRGVLNMTEMAHIINVTTAAMTGIIDRLVRDGYVSRENDPDDRRVIKVRATSKGNKIVKAMLEHRKDTIMKVFGGVSGSEREEYLNILTRIVNSFEAQKR